MQFEAFPKIRRIFKDNMIITEKLDGTNAQVYIFPANEVGIEGLPSDDPDAKFQTEYALGFRDGYGIAAGSRTRWITPGPKSDNFGFAKWVQDNQEELFKLGEGRHFGEWWGHGIQRGYGLTEKRFSLFNTSRWSGNNAELRPKCCHVVPVLGCWTMDTGKIREILEKLKETGSVAAPGFMDVEGIVVYHPASNQLFKYTVDDNHKDAKE